MGSSSLYQGYPWGCVHALHQICSERKLELPPYLAIKKAVEVASDVLKAGAPMGRGCPRQPQPALPPE